MSVVPAWHNADHTVLRYIHYGNWSWTQLDDAVAKAQDMFTSVKHPVHVIIDLRESGTLPQDSLPLLKRPLTLSPDQETMVLILGPMALGQAYYEAVSRIYREKRSPQKVEYITIIEDAHEILAGTVRVSVNAHQG